MQDVNAKQGVGTVLMQQVHGSNIEVVANKDVGMMIPNCDGLITNDINVSLGVRVADCLPIELKDRKNSVIALVHAGWRGLENGIIVKTLEKLKNEFGSIARDIEVNIGPHICVNHFEVKDDVLSKFKDYPDCVLKTNGKTYLNLSAVAQKQLIFEGVKKEKINISSDCTFENLKLPSFRRDKTTKRLHLYSSLTRNSLQA